MNKNQYLYSSEMLKKVSLVIQILEYQINPEALEFFASLQGKVAVISVAGMYRTGKSFLLNKMILNSPSGFAVGPTTNAKTKGIWVWGKPLTCHNQDNQIINVLVLDSEGLGSTQQDINHDLKLFSITLMMSSTFLYNTVGSIDQNAIDSLGLVLRLCEHLKSENFNDFPDFYWILRDFSLALVDKDGKALTTKEYLENCLLPQPGDSQIRNRIRSSIRQSFHYRNCITFVRPLTDEGSLQKLDQMELDQLRPEFVQEVIDFRKLIFQSIKTKTIKGKQVKGEMLSGIIQLYCNQINGDSLPVVQTGWKYVCQQQCQNVIELSEKFLTNKIEEIFSKLPDSKSQFESKKAHLEKQVIEFFKTKTKNNDFTEEAICQLKKTIEKKMKRLEEQMHTKNSQETKSFIKKEFQSVQRKIKQAQFKNMGELVKQFQVFYEYFRKKCPYKDEIQVGLEYLMKKFSDCSLVLFKSMKNKKQSQITTLKQQLERVSNELIIKEEKFKSQKQKLNDRLTVSQSSLSNLEEQNRTFSLIIAQNEILVEKLKNELSEYKVKQGSQNQMEIFTLKKRIMVLEDDLRENECSKGLQISNLRNNLMLKQNEVSNIREEKNLIDKRLTQTLKQLEKIRLEKEKNIEDLVNEVQSVKQFCQNQNKQFDEKMRRKNSQISKLENYVESKAIEIEQLKSQKLKLSTQLQQEAQKQKHLLSVQNKSMISHLQQKNQSLENQLSVVSRRLEQQLCQRDMDMKISKMQIEKEKAILDQKIEFLKREIEDKQDKISKLQEQNRCYLDMFDEKDNEIAQLTIELESFKLNHQNSSEEFSIKFNEYNGRLLQKEKEIKLHQRTISNLEQKLREVQAKNQMLSDTNEKTIHQLNENIKALKIKFTDSSSTFQEQKVKYEAQIQELKNEQSKNLDEQKRSIQLSIIQLKNYYEMEKQRLEKRILEDRKKYEVVEEEIIQEYEQKIKKQQKTHNEEISEYKNQIEQLQDQISRIENQFEMKFSNYEEEVENQKKILMSKYEILEKKYHDFNDEYQTLEQQTNDDRIAFIKKIEMLNFELSKKQKEVLQANSKRENAETILTKKDQQIESIKKMMNQQIENSLKKMQQTNIKYQKLNQEYLQYKMDTEKELALCKQRNEFLNSKLSELTKEKQIGSSKNLQKADKQKINELKEIIEKQKAELLTYESNLQNNKKQFKESESQYKKQIQTLQKQLQHQKQRINLQKTKNNDLEEKISSKAEIFKKELQGIKQKYQNQRTQHYKLIEQLKDKNIVLEDQKNNVSWKLQKEVALLNDKIQYAERQRDQAKKQLEESERRLGIITNQLRRNSDKNVEDQQSKKGNIERRISHQLQTMKYSMQARTDEQEEQIKKLKEQNKTIKDRNVQLMEKLHKAEKSKNLQKSLIEQNENLYRQKQLLENKLKHERLKQIDEWKRKLVQAEKNNKDLMNQNNGYMFQLEKSQSKWQMERNSFHQKLANLEDQLQWFKNSAELQKTNEKSRVTSSKRSSEMLSRYNSTSSFYKGGGL